MFVEMYEKKSGCLWKCMDRYGDAAASYSHSGAVAAVGSCSGSGSAQNSNPVTAARSGSWIHSKLKFSHRADPAPALDPLKT